MMFGRGKHHTAETQAQPGLGGTSATAADTDDEATPPIWWIKTIASWTLLAAAVALLAVLVVIPRLTGSTAYTVLTGSMTPTYPPGTLIVVKPTPGSELEAGDVITFQPESGNPSVTTHRIVSIVFNAKGERQFITKGDANNTTDETALVEGQIRGKLFYSVPFLGRINSVLSGSSRGILILLIAGALGLYALWMWISGLRDRKKPDTGENPADGNTAEPDPKAPVPGPAWSEPAEPPTRFVEAVSPARHAAPAVPTCHACGAPQQQNPPPLAYSATAPPMHSRSGPADPITQPIPVYSPSSSHN